jgi:tetratricopeptide (TPR) repeat protein
MMPIRQFFLVVHTVIVPAACTAALLLPAAGADAAGFDRAPLGWGLDWRLRGLFAEKSALVNPSFVAAEEFSSVRLLVASYPGDTTVYDLAGSVPLGTWNTAGLDMLLFGWSPPDAVAAADNSNMDWACVLSLPYAFDFWNIISLGAALTFPFECHPPDPWTTGCGADAGISCAFLHSAFWGNHRFGAAAHNLSVPDLGIYGEYRRAVRLSVSSDFLDRRIETYGDFLFPLASGNSVCSSTADAMARGGKYGLKLLVEPLPQARVTLGAGFGSSGCEYLSCIVSADFPVLYHDHDLTMGYQVLLEPSTGSYAQTVYGAMEFGRRRLSADVLQRRALKLFEQGKWAEAYMGLGNFMAVFPYFHDNPEMRFMMGICAERLFLPRFAEYEYSAVTDQYPRTRAAAKSQEKLVELACQASDTTRLTAEYEKLVKNYADADLIADADYRIGQMYMQQGDFRRALDRFDRIAPSHPLYPFALYSSGIAFNGLSQYDNALQRFNACALHTVTTVKDELITDMACLMLACFYYERPAATDSALAKCMAVLDAVPRYSQVYPYALLIKSWTACRVGRYDQCASFAGELARIGTALGHSATAEAHLLMAYSLLQQEKYGESLEWMGKKYRRNAPAPLIDSSILVDNKTIDTLSAIVEQQSSEIRMLAYSKGHERSEQKIAEAVMLLERYATAIKEHRDLVDQFHMERAFLLDQKELEENTNYVEAKALMLRGRRGNGDD